ncbi:hypothetical protein BR93DRAFT_965291 [Coniochaeta sp. PMI_546]|nr:hypothetical protein BR93DRAFT_965291 [Coniochaeta sp. PMI_546]
MDFYRSGVNLVMGNSSSGQDSLSPSLTFENGYVPFTTIGDGDGAGSSDIPSGASPTAYYPQRVAHLEGLASHDVTSEPGGREVPSPRSNHPSPIPNHPYTTTNYPSTTTNQPPTTIDHLSTTTDHPSATMNHPSSFPPTTMDHPSATMNYLSTTTNHPFSFRPTTMDHLSATMDHPSATTNHPFSSTPMTMDHLSTTMDHPSATMNNLSATMNHPSSFPPTTMNHPSSFPPTTMNHPSSSPPPPPRVPPNSPSYSGFPLGQPTFAAALPLENRRPGRPRGGRLSAIEQYYRAVAQLHYAQPRRLPGLADFDTSVASQVAAPVLGQAADQSSGRSSGQLGANMDTQPSQGLVDGLIGGLANGLVGSMAGQSVGLADLRANAALGNQQQSSGYASSMSQVAPRYAGDFPNMPSPASSAHAAHHTFSNASTLMNSCASDQGFNPAVSDTPPIHSPSPTSLRRQPTLSQMTAHPQVAVPPQVGTSYNFTAPPQPAGPSPYGGLPQHGTAPQFLAPTHAAPTAQTQPPALFAQTSSAYTQAPADNAPHPTQLAPPAPPTLIHDLPASVTARPTFQRILRMATDPKQLPPNVTPQQAQIIQQTQVHLASAKFDKVREANNKSAKRGRYKRMATTVALADEIMRQKAEMKHLEEENDKLSDKLVRVESVMPGITNATEVIGGPQPTNMQQPAHGHGGFASSATSSFFDEASQTFKSSASNNYESSQSNALGITLPTMTDVFGSPIQHPNASAMTQSNSFNLTLPSTSGTSTVPTVKVDDTNQDDPEDNPDEPDLSLDRQFLREAHDMRLQLIDAVKGDKLHELGFGCHDEIDAVIQRGRRIRASLGMPDDDYDRWIPPVSNAGRRKRSADEPEEEETKAPAKKMAKRSRA